MKEQHYKNHSRYIIGYHFITLGAIVAILVLAVILLSRTLRAGIGADMGIMMVLIALVLASFFIFARQFALKAQDRAIRAEENLRHYVLTGKLLDKRLRMGQVIALRFASDEELPALAQKAAETGMSGTDIKKAIENWRADHHRA